MFSQMTARGMISYPLKENFYSDQECNLKNLFKSLPTTFKRDYFLELKKNLGTTLKIQQIGKTCLNAYCSDLFQGRFYGRLSLCHRCWQHFQRHCCLPTLPLKVSLRRGPRQKKNVLLDFPGSQFIENTKRQKLQNASQEFEPQPFFFSQTPEGQNSSSNASLNNTFTTEVLNETLKFSESSFVKSSDPAGNSNSANSTEKDDDIFSTLENVIHLPDDKNECRELDIFYSHFAENKSSLTNSEIKEAPCSLIKRICSNSYCNEINPKYYAKLQKICKRCEVYKKAHGACPTFPRRIYKQRQ